MKKIQITALACSVITFVLSACLDSKNNAPSPASNTELQTNTIPSQTTTGTTTTGTTTTNTAGITFVDDIMPMLKRECLACHQAPTNSGGINLETYAQVKKYVDNGKLYGSISGAKGFSKMPPGGALASVDVAKVKTWIDTGAANNAQAVTPPVAVVPPVVVPPVVTPPVVTPPITNGATTITIDCPNGSMSAAANVRATGDAPKDGTTTSTNIATVCFDTQVLPFFQSSCAFSGCHNAQSNKEGYNLSNYSSIVSKGIKAGNANSSEIYTVMTKTGKDRMPPAPYPAISKDKLDIIAKWINEGASNKVCGTANGGTATGTTRTVVVNFSAVNAIMQSNCVSCHQTGFASAGINLDNYNSLKTYGANGRLYGSITGAAGYKKMPPGGQLTTCDVMVIKKWIDLGMLNN